MNEYEKYQSYLRSSEYLEEFPTFLFKYIDLDFMSRLNKVSLLCGMEYASKSAYDFKYYVSRLDHSYNVALITWKLTHDKKATLAALFHDASTPVFSHVVDYMNGDYINQESTEEKTEEVLRLSNKLEECLLSDGLTIEDVSDFKKYSIVDLDRPKMCADRIDNIISVGMAWVGELNFNDAKRIIDDLYVSVNEFGEEEITFKSEDIALYVKEINDVINKLTHSNVDNYMMQFAANILKKCIELDVVRYDDLFCLTEEEMVRAITIKSWSNTELANMWKEFTSIDTFPEIDMPEVKNKVLLPLVRNNRLN